MTNLPPNHSIVFWTDAEGHLVAEVNGVQGAGCDGLLDILKGLGVTVSEEDTPDHDRPSPNVRGRTVGSTVNR
jgi:hypothetical protein